MVAKGWLFAGTLREEAWKTDRELVDWCKNGWIEMDAEKGFRITRLGEKVSQNVPAEQPSPSSVALQPVVLALGDKFPKKS